MLWKVIVEVEGEKAGTLREAIVTQDSINLLGYNHTPKQFIDIVMSGRKANRSEPVARLLTGTPPAQPNPTK